MNTIEEKINELITPFLQEIEKDLNKWCVEQITEKDYELNEDVVIYPKIGSATLSLTQVPMTDDVFSLEDYIAGQIKIEKVKKSDVNQIIIRTLIGYQLINEICSGKKSVNSLKPTIKKMIIDLQKTKGFGPDKLNSGIYGIFKRPGNENVYLKDVESYAAMELRLYSNSILCE